MWIKYILELWFVFGLILFDGCLGLSMIVLLLLLFVVVVIFVSIVVLSFDVLCKFVEELI